MFDTEQDLAMQKDNPRGEILLSQSARRQAEFPERYPFPPGLAEAEHINCCIRPENHIVGVHGFHPFGMERFKLLRHRLNRIRRSRRLTSLLIASTAPREGKTTVAVNIAHSLAMTSGRVLLVDADLRKPSTHRVLGIQPLTGLAEYLAGKLKLSQVCRILDPLGFYYVPAGLSATQPVEMLQSTAFRGLARQLAEEFDWVIYDSPPLAPFADGHCLAGLTDGVLLVVRQGFLRRDELLNSVASLKGSFVAGVVLNQTEESEGDIYNYYYGAPSARRAPWLASTQWMRLTNGRGA